MIRLLSAALALSLTACGQPPAPPPETPPIEARGAPPLPPVSAAPRYVGLWAAEAAHCDNPPWRFEQSAITTLGEVRCAFEDVRETAGGYEIAALCTALAPPTAHTITLSFADSERGMQVAGGPWEAPIGLVYCRALS